MVCTAVVTGEKALELGGGGGGVAQINKEGKVEEVDVQESEAAS